MKTSSPEFLILSIIIVAGGMSAVLTYDCWHSKPTETPVYVKPPLLTQNFQSASLIYTPKLKQTRRAPAAHARKKNK
jgi:hypothetical protein